MTTLDDVRSGWDAAAQQDAMGHILTTGAAWNAEEFYANGREEITMVLGRLDDLGLRGQRREKALDFGCGVGRLTVALADHYDRVIGIDISEHMIAQAREHPQITYLRSDSLDWVRARSLDLVYSNLVLQHMPQEYQHTYIVEFIRVLRKDGLAVFELPAGPDVAHSTACLSMWAIEPDDVKQTVEAAGGLVIDVEHVVEHPTWRPYRYTARRVK